jgi:sugar lactone lactonase YvrE
MRRMRASTVLASLCSALVLAACGDSGTTGSGTTSGSGGGGTGGGATTSAGGSGSGATTSAGGSGSGGGDPACEALPAGPLSPVLETSAFDGSEDLAFDGTGGIVAKNGNQIVRVDASDASTPIATLSGQAYGLRYGITGDLFVARPSLGTLARVTPAGMVTDFATGLSGPNGVYPDLDGNVWVTEFGGGKITRLDSAGAKTPILSGLDSPNGIVLDPTRDRLFYTEYAAGKVMSVDPSGTTAPVEVGGVTGAALDGLVMDACGNVYAMDQGNARLYRFELDAGGALVGTPVMLAEFPSNVANAQFGSGAGWDPQKLYVSGNPGDVYSIDAGVSGAPVAGN